MCTASMSTFFDVNLHPCKEHFKRLNKKQKLDVIHRGVNPENDELMSTIKNLTKEVQNFILSTKRFTAMEIEI